MIKPSLAASFYLQFFDIWKKERDRERGNKAPLSRTPLDSGVSVLTYLPICCLPLSTYSQVDDRMEGQGQAEKDSLPMRVYSDFNSYHFTVFALLDTVE